MKALITVGVTLVLVSSVSAKAPQNQKFQRESEAVVKQLAAPGGVKRLAAELRAMEDDEALDRRLSVLAVVLESTQNHQATTDLFDELMAGGYLHGAILAGDLLLHRLKAVETSAFSATKSVKSVPASYGDRAVRLLSHENPVVQAQGEWVLALRVKKHGATAKRIDERFRPKPDDAAWYKAWTARSPRLWLRDDYARQLILLNAHRQVAAIARQIEEVDRRQQAMLRSEAVAEDLVADRSYRRALDQARAAIKADDLGAAQAGYLALREAARAAVARRRDFPAEGFVFFTGHSVPGGDWNVNVNVIPASNSPGGDVYVKRSADPAEAATTLLDGRLGDGSVRGMDLDWDGQDVLFSFWHQPIDKSAAMGWREENAHLYRMPLPSAAEPVALTSDVGVNDVEPCFLPDGGYVFASDRSGFGNQCAGAFIQDKRCTTLFRLEPQPGSRPIAISNNKDFDRHPHVLNDGTLVFMHWEYQERGLYHTHAVWRCRPDGTNMDALFKQHLDTPRSIRDVRQAPQSPLCVATLQGHHNGQYGPLLLFNPSMGINHPDAIRLLTAGCTPTEGGFGDLERRMVAQGGVRVRGGSFISPFPMSERGYLAGYDQTDDRSEFSLYFLDLHGHLELLHRDAAMSCFTPIALRKRDRPPVVADTKKPDMTHAVAFLEDVYRDLPGVARGEVKYLRVSQSLPLPAPLFDGGKMDRRAYNHLHWLPGDATASHFAYWSWSPTRTIGLVEVADDGSAYFKVPAGTPVYLQALDKDFLEVRRMRTSFTMQRGEFRGCVGCHESRLESAGSRQDYQKLSLGSGPQTPRPAPWGDEVLDYRKHIQSIWDRHCVSCHGEKDPAGGIELTARVIGGFAQSYRALFGLKPSDPTPVRDLKIHLTLHPEATNDAYVTDGSEIKRIHGQMQQNRWPGQLVSISDRLSAAEITRPRQFGSHESGLIRVLMKPNDPSHGGLRQAMGPESWLRLVTWIDYNANYHSTLMDKSDYQRRNVIVRVPFRLPSVWDPGDVNPLYLNRADDTAMVGPSR